MNGVGIIITGAPGVGKSQLAYHLLNRGHQFICDDATDLLIQAGDLMGQSPPAIFNQLWLNGIGLMDVEKTWGTRALLKTKKPDFLIHLVSQPLKPIIDSQLILGISIPRMTLSNQSSLLFFAETLTSFFVKPDQQITRFNADKFVVPDRARTNLYP